MNLWSDQALITLKEPIDVEQYTRFSVWDGNKPIGEYITRELEMPSEYNYMIDELRSHSQDGINLDYETTHPIYEGFVNENVEEIFKLLESGEDGYVKGKYIKIFPPKFPSLKEWNCKFKDCHEKWVKESEFEEQILNHIGEATYEDVLKAINDGKTIEYRHICCEWYTDSIFRSGGNIPYLQVFADGKNLGWVEDHPHREYKKLEDGRTIAIGEPTVYYDIILADCFRKYETHRVGSLTCWIKKSN